jgi:hypothetical protein
LLSLGLDRHFQELAVCGSLELVLGHFLSAEENIEIHGNSLETEHVVSVGRDLDFELGRLLGAGSVIVQFNAELEA